MKPKRPALPLVATAEMKFQAMVKLDGHDSLVGGLAWEDKTGVWHATIDYWWYGEGEERQAAITKVLEAYCDTTKI